MKRIREKLTDTTIRKYLSVGGVDEIRCTTHPMLMFRYSRTNRCVGTFSVLYRNSKHRVGKWPQFKVKDAKASLGRILDAIGRDEEAKLSHDYFETVEPLLTWYLERELENRYLSKQRKDDISSSVNRHLLPLVGNLDVNQIDKAALDNEFFRPMKRKGLARATIEKHFSILKSAFVDALNVQMVQSNPLAGMKITSFIDAKKETKGSKLKPVQVPNLLDSLDGSLPVVKLLVLTMLSIGTRIGETLASKWDCIYLDDEKPEWFFPYTITKNSKDHTVSLPPQMVCLLKAWREHQKTKRTFGNYVFADLNGEKLSSADAQAYIRGLSNKEWTSHDLRKCARICWAEQGVDYAIGERMLNHSLGKVAEAYLDSRVIELRKQALEEHCNWLIKVSKNTELFSQISANKKDGEDTKAA